MSSNLRKELLLNSTDVNDIVGQSNLDPISRLQ